MNSNEKNTVNIVIAGGGSAGWMAAAFLSEVFNIKEYKRYSITLVESSKIAPIGVGEATIHTMRGFLGACGINEGDFITQSDATFKHGILFKDWLYAPGEKQKDHQYFHPFEGFVTLSPEPLASHWLNATLKNATQDRYDRWAGVQAALAAAGSCPKTWQDSAYEAPISYGYHLDANKFATYLQKISVSKGVKHIKADIEDVHLHSDGSISQLILSDDLTLKGDFFIDCTGFSSLLASKLSPEFIDYSNHLFCDEAVTIRLPQEKPNYAPRPYTTATARDSGWTFEIDLQKRTGLGYIYSGKHCDPSSAEASLRSFFPDITDDLSANHLKMKVGRYENSWNRNCVSLGLSSGFLEPLESTGLYFIEIALRLLVDYWDPKSQAPECRNKFNEMYNSMFDETMEFIVLHYILSKRTDSEFWNDVQTLTEELPSLSERLALWSHKAPTDGDFRNDTVVFKAPNYAAVIYGMDSLPKSPPMSIAHIPSEKSIETYESLKRIQKMAVDSSPKHAEYLRKYTASFQ